MTTSVSSVPRWRTATSTTVIWATTRIIPSGIRADEESAGHSALVHVSTTGGVGARRLPNEAAPEYSSTSSLSPSDRSYAAEEVLTVATGDAEPVACDVHLMSACAQGRHAVLSEMNNASSGCGGPVSWFPVWSE